MMSGKQDSANAIVSIKPGAGGTDACDWAEILYRMYARWAQRHGFTVEEQDLEPNLEAGIQSVTFQIVGDVRLRLHAERDRRPPAGAHQPVRRRATPGRRRSPPWTCCRSWTTTSRSRSTRRDLEMQTFCSGGPGGQHQNKTQSGVRLIHKSGRPGREPDRAEPAQELRQRPEAAQGPALRDRGAEADGRPGEAVRREGRDRLRLARSAATSSSRTRWSATSATGSR